MMTFKPKARLIVGLSFIIFIISFTSLLAQSNSLFVTVTRFEPQPNGNTVAYVTVVDDKGLPVAGLTKADFSIMEDDQLNLSDQVTVEATNDTQLRLVLALDVSMPPPEVATMKEAAIRYIQSLQAKDQVALIVFFDETKLVQDFTEDKAKLVSIVEALQPEGDFTTLHETVFNATTKASQFEIGRRAVIVVTNSGNNINAPYTSEETIKHATELQVPLYVIALQTLNRLTDFQDVSRLTGGQSYILNNAGEVANSLSEIDKLLRPAYKITYPSQIPPDNQKHTVRFGVKGQPNPLNTTTPPATGQDQTEFVAVLDKIDVKIIGVNEGQTVTGLVNLMAEVTSPNKNVKVQYCLDNQVLGEATEPPYVFEWNTNKARPGSSVLCAKAVDAAGNVGEAKLRVRVPVPIAVTIATDPRHQVAIGQPITVEAKVVALSDVAQVDFLVNGDTLGTDTTPPYQFAWNNRPYMTGTYTLTARAVDVLGGQSEDSTPIRLVAAVVTPSEPTLSWWQRFLRWIRAPYALWKWVICLTLLFLLLLLPFILLLARYLRNKGRRLAHVELTNLGNISSRYEVRAQNPDDALIFQFSLNQQALLQRQVKVGHNGITPIYTTGLPLGARPVAGPLPVGSSSVAGQQTVGSPAAQGQSAPSPSSDPNDPAAVDNSPQAKVKKLTALGRMGGIFGEILFAVSYIFPAFLATPMRTVAQTLRRADMASQRIDRGVKQLDQIQGQPSPAAPARPATPNAAPSTGAGISNPLSGSQDKIKQATALGRMGGVIGEVLFAVSYIFPAFLATPLRTVAQTLRRADMAAQRVDRGVQQLDRLQGPNNSNAATTTPDTPDATDDSAPASPSPSTSSPTPANPSLGTALSPAPNTIQTPYAQLASAPPDPSTQPATPGGHVLVEDVVVENWAESPYITPGSALTLDLWIQAVRPYRTKRYPFVITSRSVEQEAAPVVVEQGEIMLYNVLALHRIFWPIAVYITIILSVMVSVTLALLVVGILH